MIWNEEHKVWDTDGVRMIHSDDVVANCMSHKLGTFAVLTEVEHSPTAPDDYVWLLVTKFVGYGLSIILLLAFSIIVLMSK